MDFDGMIQMIGDLLSKEDPEAFSSSWILKRSSPCYRFIWKNVRTDYGTVDWDRVTRALEWKFQRRWAPRRCRRASDSFQSARECNIVLERYRSKLYVFISPQDEPDRCSRDIISINLVRLAQCGNELAKRELLSLLSFTIDDWLDRYCFLSRWRGYDAEIRMQVEQCIRRYRYSGSFIRYLFRTLEYAARGIPPFQTHSLDEPVSRSFTAQSYMKGDHRS